MSSGRTYYKSKVPSKLILLDKSEVVLFVPTKNNYITNNLVSSQILRIQFDKITERKFGIIPQESEKIAIITSKNPDGIVYTKAKNKKFFDEYKAELTEYAKEYNIKLIDNTK